MHSFWKLLGGFQFGTVDSLQMSVTTLTFYICYQNKTSQEMYKYSQLHSWDMHEVGSFFYNHENPTSSAYLSELFDSLPLAVHPYQGLNLRQKA